MKDSAKKPENQKAKKPKTKKGIKYCEICGAWPAIYRWYSGKDECCECGQKSFRKFIGFVSFVATTIIVAVFFI